MISNEFLLTALIIVLIPGSGVLYTVSTGLTSGKKASIYAAAGCTLGIIPHLLASVFGLAALLYTSSLAFSLFKYAGAIYLLYLAWMMWRESGQLHLNADQNKPPQSGFKTASRGLLINVLNPKLSIFFLAFLPQFMPSDSSAPLTGMLLLSAVFMLMTFVVFIIYGLFAHSVSHFVRRTPSALSRLQKSFSGVFVALSIKLSLSER